MALGRGLAAGHLPEPDHVQSRRNPLPGDDDPRAVEREAECADLERKLRGPLLPEERPAGVWRRSGARSSSRDQDERRHPDRLLQGRGFERLLLGSFRFGILELPERRFLQHTDRRPRQGHPVLRLLLAQLLHLPLCQAAAEAGEPPGLEVLRHGQDQPRAEIQLQLPPADRRLDLGLAGQPERGSGRYGTFGRSPIARDLSGRAAGSSRRNTGAARSATRSPRAISRWRQECASICSRQRTFARHVVREPHECGADGSSWPEVKYHGAKGWQFQFTNWQPRVSATYALGEGKSTVLRASYARFADQLGNLGYLPERNADPERLRVLLERPEPRSQRPARRDPVRPSFVGYFNGIDPAVLPNAPNQIQPGLKMPATNEITAGVEHQLTNDFAVSGTFSYRNTSNLLSQIPIGSSLVDLRARRPGDRQRHGGQRLHAQLRRALLQPHAPRSRRPASNLTNRPGATQRYYGVDVSIVKKTLRQLDGARQLRLEQLQAVSDAAVDPESQQSLGSRGPERQRRPRHGFFDQVQRLDQCELAVQHQRSLPGALGLDLRRELLRAAGLSQSLLRQRADARRREQPVSTLDRQGWTPTATPTSTSSTSGYKRRSRSVRSRSSRQPSSSTSPTPTPSSTAYPNVGNYDGDSSGEFEPEPNFNQIIEVQSPRIVRLGLQVNF